MQRYGWFLRAAVLVVACSPAGCGADEQPAPQSPPTATVSAGFGVLVVGSSKPEDEKLKAALERRLVEAGYRVVASSDEPHDVIAQLDTQLSEKASLLTVYVNGKPKKHFLVHANLSIQGGQQVLGGGSIEYDADDGPSTDDVTSLVKTIRGDAVTRYVSALRDKRRSNAAAENEARDDAEAQQEEAELAKRRDAAKREEASWNQIVLSDCINATRIDGCDSLKGFLAQFPTGRHAHEAKQAVEAGAVIVAKLADDRDWSTVRVEACREPTASNDCDAVTAYVSTHPAGAHLEEARAALSRSEKRRAQLRESEDKKRQRDAEQVEQEQKRAAREQCKKDCIGNVCFNLRPGTFEICMDRCVKANCE